MPLHLFASRQVSGGSVGGLMDISEEHKKDEKILKRRAAINFAFFAVFLISFKLRLSEVLLEGPFSSAIILISMIGFFATFVPLFRLALKVTFYPGTYVTKSEKEDQVKRCNKCNRSLLSEDVRGQQWGQASMLTS